MKTLTDVYEALTYKVVGYNFYSVEVVLKYLGFSIVHVEGDMSNLYVCNFVTLKK